jgi:rubrerythrin
MGIPREQVALVKELQDGTITPRQFEDAFSRLENAEAVARSNYSAWRCHYCGSLVKNDVYKCPSCNGERR